uniref:Uncharacterized protein n=1 Tax=Pyrodinium bahamense TaxID=73915 RepID=A0A7S0ARJ0_9DINO
MKLDCEGCEWHVGLPWLRTGLFGKIFAMRGEFHMFNRLVCEPRLAIYLERRMRPLPDFSAPHGGRCIPENLSHDEAVKVWRVLCSTPRYRLSGCEEYYPEVFEL